MWLDNRNPASGDSEFSAEAFMMDDWLMGLCLCPSECQRQQEPTQNIAIVSKRAPQNDSYVVLL